MGKPMAPKGSVRIRVPELEVIWKNEWPNHLISTFPEAATFWKKGASSATWGLRQAAGTSFGVIKPAKQKRHIRESKNNLFIFHLSNPVLRTEYEKK
jgi:hypothetical protein